MLSPFIFLAIFSAVAQTNRCPDPSYQVPVMRICNHLGAHSYIPSNWESELVEQRKRGNTIYFEGNYTLGCVINHEKLDIFKAKCPGWSACDLAPLCFRTNNATDGHERYRTTRGVMPTDCGGAAVVGYTLTKYDCCQAVAPVRDMMWNGAGTIKDYVMNLEDVYYDQWIGDDLPFFTWPVEKVPECPDRSYMIPIVRTYSDRSDRKNYYFFLMDDMNEWSSLRAESTYRDPKWRSIGCAIRKDRLAELERVCPQYKECGVRPLCSVRWKDESTNAMVYRLVPGAWDELVCGQYPHIGYIPTMPNCCGANTLLTSFVRVKGQPLLPANVITGNKEEIDWFTKLEWIPESTYFYVWPVTQPPPPVITKEDPTPPPPPPPTKPPPAPTQPPAPKTQPPPPPTLPPPPPTQPPAPKTQPPPPPTQPPAPPTQPPPRKRMPPKAHMSALIRSKSKTAGINHWTGRIVSANEMATKGYERVLPDLGYIGKDTSGAEVKAACPDAVPLYRIPHNNGVKIYYQLAPHAGIKLEGYVVTSPVCGAKIKIVEFKHNNNEDRVYVSDEGNEQMIKQNRPFLSNYHLVGTVFYIWSQADFAAAMW